MLWTVMGVTPEMEHSRAVSDGADLGSCLSLGITEMGARRTAGQRQQEHSMQKKHPAKGRVVKQYGKFRKQQKSGTIVI